MSDRTGPEASNGMENPHGSGDAPRWLVPAIGVGVATVVAALLWIALYPAPHNGGDNAGYLTLAHSLLSEGAYLDLWRPDRAAHTKYPPFYPSVLSLLMALGFTSFLAFKLVSLLSVVGTAVLTYVWVARHRSPWGAAALALVVAISPGFLWASNWILSDPLFVLLTLVALVAFDRAENPERDGSADGDEPVQPARSVGRWIGLGAAAAILATLTRTAGLPLVLAAVGSLALAGRRRALAGFGLAFALPQLLWWLRSHGTGDAAYISEFWMVNPYDPSLGRAGVGDLVSRAVENAQGYVGTHIPGGLTVYEGGVLTLVGVLLFGLAVVGWVRRCRDRIGFVEMFTPLYFGLILLWPAVWSGDRFALPLFPVLLFYAWGGIDVVLARAHRLAPPIAASAFAAVLLVPSLGGWSDAHERAEACSAAVAQAGPFACYGPGFQEFVAAARWFGENLPEGSVVLTRKPRIFYTLSGMSSDTYPFTTEADDLLASAERVGARYVLLDRIDRLGYGYVAPAVSARPGRFCSFGGIGAEGGTRTELLGILPADSGEGGLTPCPEDMVLPSPRSIPAYSSGSIPLLAFAAP